jgi:phage terminase large subunit-like protein
VSSGASRQNTPLETIWVQHVSRGLSLVQFKSYDQRRLAFQGTAQHLVWLDEEPDFEIYTECLLRTAETSDFSGGLILLTFTPLLGMTPLVSSFLPKGVTNDAAGRQRAGSRVN